MDAGGVGGGGMSDEQHEYDDHSIFDPELDELRKQTLAYQLGELGYATRGCMVAIADRLFAPPLAFIIDDVILPLSDIGDALIHNPGYILLCVGTLGFLVLASLNMELCLITGVFVAGACFLIVRLEG
jgi:hypothetical protein